MGPLQISEQKLQIFFLYFILFYLRVCREKCRSGGKRTRRTCCILEMWGCSIALSWGSRENVDHFFDSLGICIITFVYQWELGNKAWPLTDVLEVLALHDSNNMWARSRPGVNKGMNKERSFLSLKRFSLNVEAASCAGNALTEPNGVWHTGHHRSVVFLGL